MVLGQHCTVDAAATLSLQKLLWSLWCAHLHAAKHYHGGATIHMFFLWDKFDKGEHSDLLVFQYSSWSSLLSH